MKVLALSRHPGQLISAPPALEIIVDSATVSVPRPLFLPDFDLEWCVKVYPAFKISRLGKDIAADFASRYFDSFTAALRLFPNGTNEWLDNKKLPKGVLGIYDYCLGLGEWHSWSDSDSSIEVNVNGNSLTLTKDMIDIDRVIESVSHYTTLKTGDVILPCELPLHLPVQAGNDVKIEIDGFPSFHFKIR